MVTEEELRLMKEQLASTTKLLKEMKEKQVVTTNPSQNKDEMEEIKEDISEHEAKALLLQNKLADKNNYNREDQNAKAIFEIDKIWQSLVEPMRKETIETIQKYRNHQEELKTKLDYYQEEFRQLKTIISEMELKLNRDTLAERQGIVNAQFSVDDKVDYVQLMMYYQNRITKITKIIEFLSSEVNMYDRFLTRENEKLNTMTRNAGILNEAKANSSSVVMPKTDSYALYADKASLAKHEKIISILKNKLDDLMYNPIERLEKQIAENETVLSSNKDNHLYEQSSASLEKEEDNETHELEDKALNDLEQASAEMDKFLQAVDNIENQTLIDNEESSLENEQEEKIVNDLEKAEQQMNEFLNSINNLKDDKKKGSDEEIKETEENAQHDLKHPSEEMIDSLKEDNNSYKMLSFESASESLKAKKNNPDFIESWDNWAKEMKAAAITVEIPNITNTPSVPTAFRDDNKRKDDSGDRVISNMQLGTNKSLYSGVTLDKSSIFKDANARLATEESLKVK